MGHTIERILENMDWVFNKDGWHAPLLKSVQDLTAGQAAWQPEPERNSIWQIVDHVALWKEYYTNRMAGGPRWERGWRKKLDWQEVTDVSEPAWRAAVQRLVDAHEAVKAELSKRTDEDLTRMLPDSAYTGSKYPLSSIEGMVAHDAYHCGQIRYIRALQGVLTERF